MLFKNKENNKFIKGLAALMAVGGSLFFANNVFAGPYEDARGAGGTRTYTMDGDYTITSTGSVTGNFTIIGNLANALELDASGQLILDASNATGGASDVYEFNGASSRNMYTNAGGTVTIENIVMRDGSSGLGGAFYNGSGTTNVTNSAFINNKSTGNGGAVSSFVSNFYDSYFYGNSAIGLGGAISYGEVTVEVDNTTFNNNYSSKNGGAIASRGDLTVTNSNFNNNSALLTGGAIHLYANSTSLAEKLTVSDSSFVGNSSGSGGAIYNAVGEVVVTNSVFEKNTASDQGGAIFNTGKITISDSRFIENKIDTTGTASYQGGALRVQGESTISNSVFEGNGVYTTTISAQGGAILSNGTLTIENSSFINNVAASATGNGRGGAIENSSGKILNIISTVFEGNSTTGARVYGGAIYNVGTLNISAVGGVDTIFKDNTANGKSNAIYNASVVNFNSDADSKIVSYDIFSNGTYNLQSGLILLTGPNGHFSQATLNVTGGKISTIDDAIRTTNLGNLILSSDLLYGIDVDLSTGQGDKLTNTDANFAANGHNIVIDEINIIADGSTDVTLANNAEIKAAITLDADAIITKLASVVNKYKVISYNALTGVLDFARTSLKIAVNSTETERIYMLDGEENVDESLGAMGGSKLTISGLNTEGTNYAITTLGPNIFGASTSAAQTLTISDVSNISGFEKTGDGAFVSAAGSLIVKNTTFSDNVVYGVTTSEGGAIYKNSSTLLDISGSVFNDNMSQYLGGAIFNSGNNAKNSIVADFYGNSVQSTSRVLGGAIYLGSGGYLKNVEGTFEGNFVKSTSTSTASDALGGALASYGANYGNVTATFIGNYAQGTDSAYAHGGAIRANTGSINITDSKFVGNYADSNKNTAFGGAIISTGANVKVTDTNFFDNYAKSTTSTAQGGAIYNTGTLAIAAQDEDVYFSGNYTEKAGVKDYNAIYIASGDLSLSAAAGQSIVFNDSITSSAVANTITIGTNGSLLGGGTVVFNDTVSNASIILNSGEIALRQENAYNANGYTGEGAHEMVLDSSSIFNNVNLTMAGGTTLNALNNVAEDINFNTLILDGDVNISIDADLALGKADKISAASVSGSGSVIIDSVNLISDSTIKNVELEITDNAVLAGKISIVGIEILKSSGVSGFYNVAGYNTSTGVLTIARFNLVQTIAQNMNDKTYGLLEDEDVESALGTLVGNKLDIVGTGTTYAINGQGNTGITVNAGQELNVVDVSNITGFNSATMGGFLYNKGTATIENSTFVANSATTAGGVFRNEGTLDIVGSTFEQNVGGSSGSSVLSNTGTATITDSSFNNNTGNVIGTTGTVNILGSSFSGNTNTSGNGGAIRAYSGVAGREININTTDNSLTTTFSSNKATKGGAVSIEDEHKLTAFNAVFNGNSATLAGGALYNENSASLTGGSFTDNFVESNQANSGGGAIFNSTGATLFVDGTSFSNNEKKGATGVLGFTGGGAIYNSGTIEIDNASFNDNKSDYRGGAIYNNSGDATIENTSFERNTATWGGAVYNGSTMSFDNVVFRDNAAISWGGAVYNIDNSEVTINNSSFYNNTAASGGAIGNHYTGSVINLNAITSDIIFQGNKAGSNFVAIENVGTVNLYSDADSKIITYDAFLGSGTYNLIGGTLQLFGEHAEFGSNSKVVVSNGSTISTVDGVIRETNVGEFSLEDDANWGLDIDLATKTSDTLVGTYDLGDKILYLSELNVLGSLSMAPAVIDITDIDTLAKAIELSSTINVHTATSVVYNLMMNYDKTTGELKFDIVDINDAFSLDIDEKVYVMGSDINANTAHEALGPLVGDGFLSLSGNNNDVNGGGFGGTSVSSTQTLSIADVKLFDNFAGTAIANEGTVNIKAEAYDVTFGANADIENLMGGDINISSSLTNSVILNNDITGLGVVNIAGNVFANATIENNNISLSSGILNIGKDAVLNNVSLAAKGGMFNLVNGEIGSTSLNVLSLGSADLKLGLDIDLKNKVADEFDAAYVNGSNKIFISELNVIDDASKIDTTFNIFDDTLKGYVSLSGVNITAPTGSTENYNSGYLVGYSTATGDITFSYATLETAFSSSVLEKAYSMVAADESFNGALSVNGDSLSIDGNGLSINASNINVNGKDLTITDAVLNSSLSGLGNIELQRNVTINSDVSAFDGVASLNGGMLTIGKDAVFFDNTFNISNNPTMNLQNGVTDVLNASKWNLSSDLNVMIDVDLENKKADSFEDFGSTTNKINISAIYLTSEKQGQTTVSITNGNGGGNFSIDSSLLKIVDNIYQYQYNVDDTLLESDGFLTFTDTEYKEFNPAIVDSLVAKQSQYLSNIAVYKEAFANFGTEMPTSYRGMPSGDFEEITRVWFRPFGKNEDVNLDNGYSVSNESFGALFGMDGQMKFYDNCWNGISSVYAGYINSVQEYDDVRIEQDGAVVGIRALFERQNLFTGITANISASFADGTNMFGKEDFAMYSTGIASKTGYNFGFANNKYVIQPSIMMSYTYIYTPAYDNSTNTRISKQKLNAFQITPEVKFVANFEDKWQAYAGGSYNWNVISSSEVKANDIALPNVSVDPYAEFRIGASKKFDNEIDSFVEFTTTVGGREGFGVEAGVRYNF